MGSCAWSKQKQNEVEQDGWDGKGRTPRAGLHVTDCKGGGSECKTVRTDHNDVAPGHQAVCSLEAVQDALMQHRHERVADPVCCDPLPAAAFLQARPGHPARTRTANTQPTQPAPAKGKKRCKKASSGQQQQQQRQ